VPYTQTVRTIARMPNKRYRRSNYRSVHHFKRTYNAGASTITCDGINPTLLALNFSMNDMPGYGELTSLYDFYRLRGVTVTALPYQQNMSNSISSVNNARNAPIFYAIDRSDTTAPSTVEEVLEYQDHKISNVWAGFKIYVKNPKFADNTSGERGGWVATSNPVLNWYGLKVSIPPTGVATSFYLLYTIYISCKDPK